LFTCRKHLPYELKEIWNSTELELKPFDMNGDERDEFIRKRSQGISIIDDQLKIIRECYYDTIGFGYIWTSDINNDGIAEIFVTLRRELTDFLAVFDASFKEIVPFFPTITGEDRNKNDYWEGGIYPCGLIDVNDDGLLDVLTVIGTGLDVSPRGLAVFDLKTQKMLWKYLIGPMVWKVFIEDLNGDGKPEIVFETSAPANGNYANNTDDKHTYVIVLSKKGKLLWQKEVGGYFSRTFLRISDLDLDGKKEIVVALRTIRPTPEKDAIIIFDGSDGRIKKYYREGSFMGLECADLTRDGKDEIIVGNRDGKLMIFDQNLDLISCYNGKGGIELKAVFDTDGNGVPELFAFTEDEKLIVLNNRLKEIANIRLPIHLDFNDYNTSGSVQSVKEGLNKRILLILPMKKGDKFSLLALAPIVPVFPFPILLLIIFGIIIFILSYLYARKKVFPKIRFPIPELLEKTKEGYIILNKKGKVLFANESAEKILGAENLVGEKLKEKLTTATKEIIEKDEGQIIIKTPEGEKILKLKRMKIKKGFILRIEDITKEEHLKRIESWAPVAQKLAHGIKNPLSTILGAMEQLEIKYNKEEGIKRYIELVKEEILRLKKMSDAFMKFTKLSPPVLQPKNINELIKNVMIRYQSICQAMEIKVEYELDNNLPLIPIDEEGIANVLNIIIENGIEAMEKGGILKIKIATMERFEKEVGKIKNYLRIEVSDTGKGIPEKYLNKVFDPYFTYDKLFGTGLGLTLAKRIIENHNGFIEITSKEKVGTTVSVYLPLNQNV